MKKLIFLVVAMALALTALAACGGDSDDKQEPAAVTEPAPASDSSSVSTDAPSDADADSDTMPTISSSVSTDAPSDASGDSDAIPTIVAVESLSADCLPGGVIEDAATIVSCNTQAMQQGEGFSFDGSVNLFALFPVDIPSDAQGAGQGLEGLIGFSGDIAGQDKLRFTVSVGPAGQMIETTTLLIGSDIYFQDPESNQWIKGNPPESEMFAITQMVAMLSSANDAPTELQEVIDLDDGTYVLVSEQAAAEDIDEMGVMGLGASEVTRVVGTDDFLTRAVRVDASGLSGEATEFIAINYHGHGETPAIDPPANFVELPADAFPAMPQGPAVVSGLSKNADGNVEVTFSKPVFAAGELILLVIEPSTGGWELPLLDGSGTDTLVFNAAPEGKPALVAGETQIGFLGFGPDARLEDADGIRANDLFDAWTYE